MKSIFSLGLVLLFSWVILSGIAQAQVPPLINYQGLLTDPATGNPVADDTYEMIFSIYDVPTGGSSTWSEIRSVQTQDGLFSVLLGSPPPLIATILSGPEKYLGIKVGTDPEMTPRKRIVSVAYAFVAESVSGVSNIFPSDGNVGVGTITPNGRLTVESAINTTGTVFSLPSISGLPDPSYTHDAILQWQGGETKFGKWRQYFNGYEQSWALTYNAPWDYTNNQWLGRDSGDSRANISAYMRFNVAEGNSGENTFEVNFARGANAGVIPDWNDGAFYFFYDGRTEWPAKPAKLLIRGAASMDAILELTSHETVNPLRIDLVSDGLNRRFKIRDKDTDTEYLAVDATTGDVGIRTVNPTNILTIQQNSATDPIADAWTTYSSKRWKTNIKPIDGALDKVNRLRGVSYDWKSDGKHDIGLIAEEVGEVIPEVVAYEENGLDAKSIDYSRLVAVLIEAMKEQQNQVKQQQAMIEDLKAQIRELNK